MVWLPYHDDKRANGWSIILRVSTARVTAEVLKATQAGRKRLAVGATARATGDAQVGLQQMLLHARGV